MQAKITATNIKLTSTNMKASLFILFIIAAIINPQININTKTSIPIIGDIYIAFELYRKLVFSISPSIIVIA